jgi:hypothetical protein
VQKRDCSSNCVVLSDRGRRPAPQCRHGVLPAIQLDSLRLLRGSPLVTHEAAGGFAAPQRSPARHPTAIILEARIVVQDRIQVALVNVEAFPTKQADDLARRQTRTVRKHGEHADFDAAHPSRLRRCTIGLSPDRDAGRHSVRPTLATQPIDGNRGDRNPFDI